MAAPQTILITGAASGIGRALAHHYAPSAARLLLIDRDTPQATIAELSGARAQAVGAAADVTDPEALTAAVATLAAGEPIDLVINCAGILPPVDPIDQVKPADFKRTVDVNLTGSFNVVHAVLPHLRPGSHLALIASMAGLVAGYRYAAYGASKFGVVGLGEIIRIELAQRDITTSIICPGEVSTPMVDEEIAQGDSVQRAVKLISGKPITPDTAAQLIAAGLARRRFLIIPTRKARALALIARLSPVPMRQAITDQSVRQAQRKA